MIHFYTFLSGLAVASSVRKRERGDEEVECEMSEGCGRRGDSEGFGGREALLGFWNKLEAFVSS